MTNSPQPPTRPADRIAPLDLAQERAVLGSELETALLEVLTSGQYILGPEVEAFENAFAELISIYGLNDVNGLCPGRPSQAFILMNQALAHSSQERFATADGLFARAEEILTDGAAVPPLGPVGAIRRGIALDPERLLDGSALAR